VNIARLKTQIDVGELEVGLLKVGLPAAVRVPAVGNLDVEGTVAAIAAGANPASGSYAVEIHFPNTKQRSIKSGMSTRVTIHTESGEDVAVVPSRAVVKKDHKDAVFAKAGHLAAIRFVELGRVLGNLVEITDGLSVGDTVLTSGMTTLARGDSVAVTVTGLSGGER
jgi:RND family efflux transporter MFP subunit